MNGLEIGQLIVVRVYTYGKEQPRVSSINDLFRPELYKVGLVFLVPRSDNPVEFALQFDLFLVL